MNTSLQKIAILVGGGPAPGINSVITAATIRSTLCGAEVVGVRDGFHWLMQGDLSNVRLLTRDTVSRLHFQGGSILGTSRANPTKDPRHLETVLASLTKLNVSGLITIGGDDTAFSASKLEQLAAGRLRVVHVPKTIDNDLCLPHGIPTFGFQTARHIGVDTVKNLMTDARTTSRWYFAVTMGRKAGHLALGIGKASGASITIIPEEFLQGKVTLSHLTNLLVGAIVKRLSYGRSDGVAVLAEGIAELLDPNEFAGMGTVKLDEHDHVRLAELEIGRVLKRSVQLALQRYGITMTIETKNVGYELRSADPIPYDMEYTRDLGYCAAEYLLNKGNAAMISIDNGRFTPIPFKDIMDSETGRTKVRLVDVESEYYTIAREYMVRLTPEDFENQQAIGQYAALLKMTPDEFRTEFSHLVREERIA